MSGRSVLAYLRGLCDDLDAGRPSRPLAAGRYLAPFAIPLAVGLAGGMAGCGKNTAPEPPPQQERGPVPVYGAPPAELERCQGGLDDDRDGLVDCLDPDCASAPECVPQPTTSAAAAVRVGRPEVRGPLSLEVVRRVTRRVASRLRGCVSRPGQPPLSGQARFRLVVSPSGDVTTASVVSSDLGDSNATQCLSTALRHLQFPAPAGGGVAIIVLPVTVTPPQDQ